MGLLSLAGAVSGAGNAVTQGLNTLQTGLLTSQLQKERDDMENKRLDQTNKNQVARDQAAFAHSDQAATTQYGRQQQTVQDERAYAARREQELYDLTHGTGGRLDTEADRALSQRERLLPRETEIKKQEARSSAEIKGETFAAEKPIRQGLRDEERQSIIDQGGDEIYTNAMRKLADAKESTSTRAQAAATLWKLDQDRNIVGLRDAYLTALDSGDKDAIEKTKTQYRAATEKVGESEKVDLVNASAGMRETGNEIVRLSAVMKDLMPSDPTYAATKRRLDTAEAMHGAFTARVQELSGSKMPEKAAPIKIIDPDDQAPKPGDKKGGLMEAAAPPSPTGPSVSKLPTGAIPIDQVPANPDKPQPKPITDDMTAYAQASPDLAPGKGMMARAGDDQRHTQEMLAREQPAAHAPVSVAAAGQAAPASTAPSSASRDLQSMLMNHEGFKGKPYKDTAGKTTVGYGFNLDDSPMTKEEAQPILERRIKLAQEQAAGRFPWFSKLDPVRKDAVTALTYNMGPTGLSSFKKFTQAMAAGDYQRAAEELMQSDWAEQVGPQRSETMRDMILTGRYGGAR